MPGALQRIGRCINFQQLPCCGTEHPVPLEHVVPLKIPFGYSCISFEFHAYLFAILSIQTKSSTTLLVMATQHPPEANAVQD